MRTLVDANVVLRYMLRDDKTQSPMAERTIREGAYLLPEVLAEIVYVLLGVYSVPREELAERLQILVKEVPSVQPSRTRGGTHSSNGLKIGTPMPAMSSTLRVTSFIL